MSRQTTFPDGPSVDPLRWGRFFYFRKLPVAGLRRSLRFVVQNENQRIERLLCIARTRLNIFRDLNATPSPGR
jgi:hypothetical protein